MDLIASSDALQAVCSRLARQPFVTVDTEFMRETTYYARLCLIQLASEEEAVLVDPMAPGLDLKPFFDLMADANVVKVFHSARQDLEIVWQMGGVIPTPLFDTQVAAMVCGYGDSVSYEQLSNDLAKARIDKSSRFTDWSRRPLSEAQLSYALSDVTHLVVIYKTLLERLTENGRLSWLDEEMSVLLSPDTYKADPDNAWRRLAGRLRKPKEIAVLMEVAAWREREAQNRDVPRGRVLKDDAVIDLAISAPRTPEALGRLRSIPSGFERSRTAGDILAAVERGLNRDPATVPAMERSRSRGSVGAVVELLKVLLKAVAEQEGVAPKIIATVDDLEAIADDDEADVPVLHGWRRELFGGPALALKHGRLAIAMENGRVVLEPRR
ncbi:ribonuclease D [Salinarimonas soli]|uniref:Ribonuclease D n=1 Tax=Salinarimonas soli TaxID=1638099 RepID=A0A5B2V8E7_9HYPH|nr:ribonuclease D [Salinarimonas soli]KAA2235324.1 ribonuclease D [Salinarimonas soli]